MPRPYGLLRAGFPYLKTLGEFINTSFPHDVAFGKEGRIYILCGGNSGPIAIVNLEDDDLGSFGAPDFGFRLPSHKCNSGNSEWPVRDGAILWPVQILVDSAELIYVSDEGAHRITVYDRFGEFQGKWGEFGSDEGQINRPSGIAFDGDENMFVVDTLNHRVQKFAKDGRFLSMFGSHGTDDGELNMPWGIHVDELGDVYVVDWRNDRVQKFDADGNFIFKLGTQGSGDGELNRPTGVAVDLDGDIYVCDWGNNRIQLFDAEGRFVQKFLGDATLSKAAITRMLGRSAAKSMRMRDMANLDQEKRFRNPRSVRVDAEGHMFVPDQALPRIQVYKKEAYPLTEQEIMPRFRAETLQNF